MQIIYKGRDMQQSERKILIHSIEKSRSDYFIKAYCYNRKAKRTFKWSGIQNMIEIETGEQIEDFDKYLKERNIPYHFDYA